MPSRQMLEVYTTAESPTITHTAHEQYASITCPLASATSFVPFANSIRTSLLAVVAGHVNVPPEGNGAVGALLGSVAKESQRATWTKVSADVRHGSCGNVRTFHEVAYFILIRCRVTAILVVRAEEERQFGCGYCQ